MTTIMPLESPPTSTPAPVPRVGAVAASVAISLPETVVTNAQVGARLGVDGDWIARRTGIHTRRVARPDERLDAHATASARAALAAAEVDPRDVDLVIVATTTSDELMPGAAPLVAHALGATGAGAFDVGSACTGFLSALAVGAAQVESGRARRAVVIGADFMSRITDPTDRATAAVFADGAGAIVLERTAGRGRIGPVILGSDGAGADHIYANRDDATIRMRGHETFREAVARADALHPSGGARGRRGARGHRSVRLPPGQRPHPVRGRRAARAARGAGRGLHRPVRKHIGGDAAAGVGLQPEGRDVGPR